jgi:hypothetical protein
VRALASIANQVASVKGAVMGVRTPEAKRRALSAPADNIFERFDVIGRRSIFRLVDEGKSTATPLTLLHGDALPPISPGVIHHPMSHSICFCTGASGLVLLPLAILLASALFVAPFLCPPSAALLDPSSSYSSWSSFPKKTFSCFFILSLVLRFLPAAFIIIGPPAQLKPPKTIYEIVCSASECNYIVMQAVAPYVHSATLIEFVNKII